MHYEPKSKEEAKDAEADAGMLEDLGFREGEHKALTEMAMPSQPSSAQYKLNGSGGGVAPTSASALCKPADSADVAMHGAAEKNQPEDQEEGGDDSNNDSMIAVKNGGVYKKITNFKGP